MGNNKKHSRHVATQLGKCEGLVTLLRATPHNARKGRVHLPTDIMMEHDISCEDVIRDVRSDDMTAVFERVASRAQEYLDREERLIMLPAVATDWYLDRLSKVGCHVFDAGLQKRNSWLPMALYWHKIKQTY